MSRRNALVLCLAWLSLSLLPATLRSEVQFVHEGPALRTGESGAWDGGLIGGSDVVESGGTRVLFYTAAEFPYSSVFDHLDSVQIGTTSSDDPSSFGNAVEPILRWDLGGIACPAVVHDPDATDGRPWKVWYHTLPEGPESSEIRLAVSSDGVSWEPGADGPVLTVDQAWEGSSVYNPTVLFDRTTSTYWMWYDGGSDMVRRIGIGMATSKNGVEWTKCANNPVIVPGGIDDSVAVSMSYVIRDDDSGVLEMWYGSTTPSGWQIAYATSLDGILWTKRGRIVIDGEFRETLHPNVLWDGDRYHLWYNPCFDSACHTELAHATAARTLPLASFTAAVEGDRVTFDASRTSPPPGCTIASYEWDFGDGTTGEGGTAEHAFVPGWHIVTLTVRDSCGETASNQWRIVVGRLRGDVAPWTASDIGKPRFPGSSSRAGDCVEVRAGGKPLAGTSDEFHFVWEELSDDFSRTLRIEAMEGAELGAQLGLMARESLDEGSPMAAVSIRRLGTGALTYRWNSRATSEAPVAGTSGPAVGELPGWVRLER